MVVSRTRVQQTVGLCVGLGTLCVLVTAAVTIFSGSWIVQRLPAEAQMATSQPQTSGQTPAGMGQGVPQGIAALMQRLQADPGDVAALIDLAQHFMHTEDWARAESFALRALVAAPLEVKPLYVLGIIQHGQGRHAEAAVTLEKALAVQDEPSMQYSLGVLYAFYLNDVPKALVIFDKALESATLSPELKASLEEAVVDAKAHQGHAQ